MGYGKIFVNVVDKRSREIMRKDWDTDFAKDLVVFSHGQSFAAKIVQKSKKSFQIKYFYLQTRVPFPPLTRILKPAPLEVESSPGS